MAVCYSLQMEEHLARFKHVRSLQSETHSSGRGSLEAYTTGWCHTLAVALHDAGADDLVVITPKNDPDNLIHAGIYRDGMITDAHGHHSADDWAGMWRTKSMEFDGSFRRVNRSELLAMIPERGCSEQELAEAKPLANALKNAADIDLRVWNSPPPAGSFSYVTHSESDEAHYANALNEEPRPFVHLAPSPSRAEIQANAARSAGMHW